MFIDLETKRRRNLPRLERLDGQSHNRLVETAVGDTNEHLPKTKTKSTAVGTLPTK